MRDLLEQLRAELPQLPQRSVSPIADEPEIRRNPQDDSQFVVWSQPAGGERVCEACIERKVMLFFEVPLPTSSALNLTQAISLTIEIAKRGIGIAVTNVDTDQNWSLLAPWPQCRFCDSLPAWLTADASVVPDGAQSGYPGNGITRRRGSEEFAALHRGFFGFASVMLNPTVDSAGEIYTVDAGMFLGEPTVFAPVGGKGKSIEQALASCIGEGLERYFISTPSRLGETVSHAPADFVEAPWFGARDFDGRTAAGVDAPLIELRPARRFGAYETALFPESLVKAPYLPPGRSHGAPTASSTTGASAGGCVAEASVQAIFELLERDAFWYAARTGWVLDRAGSEFARELASGVSDLYDVEVVLAWVKNPLSLPVAH